MKIQVISRPPIVVQGLIRPVTGVLESLRVLSLIFAFIWNIPVNFVCFLLILSTGRNKKLRIGVFP